jgi:hypothetical protein
VYYPSRNINLGPLTQMDVHLDTRDYDDWLITKQWKLIIFFFCIKKNIIILLIYIYYINYIFIILLYIYYINYLTT